jgi:hypothetical protein
MNSRFSNLILLLLVLLLGSARLFAQSEQRPENLLDEDETEVVEETVEVEEQESPASNVVDVNEENFRRSMELRDQSLQRSPDLTTGTYSRGTGLQALDALPEGGTGLQALDALPEDSQKHLRGQLREVIVENGPWTPEEADTSYPYVPSEEAQKNGTLEKREQTAWGEMVAEYHEREAAIHANAARTQAATTSNQSANGQQQEGQNNDGESGESASGKDGEPGTQESQQGEDEARAARQAALTDILNSDPGASPGGSAGEAASTEAGTEQNALELLTRRQQLPAGSEAQSAPAVSVAISNASGQSQQQSEDGESEDQALILDSGGVIAIEDLDKVKVDPQDSENN